MTESAMYNDIADIYHLIYEDWDAAIQRQANGFNQLIVAALGDDPVRLLDISCGIGTQSLGLSALGHNVTASDLSPASVRRASREAAARALDISFGVADMRHCFDVHSGGFDLVLTSDNSLPHLPTREDIRQTLQAMCHCLRPGGLAMIGMRDYAGFGDRGRDEMWAYGVRHEGDERYFVFQTRDWEGDTYVVGMYFVREATEEQPAAVISGTSRYYAVAIDDVMAMLEETGFVSVTRCDDVIYQPVITARKPG